MGLFSSFKKKPIKPYKNEATNTIYDLLFCDKFELYRTEPPHLYPWDIFATASPDIEKLKTVAADKTLEARLRILAYNLLRAAGSPSNKKELFGVIVEVALPDGLDVLAAYNDGTARYINHSEKMIIWDASSEISDGLIQKLLSESAKTVDQLGPWDKERRPFPTKGMTRLTFLVSDGLYFGEGPFDLLQADPKGGAIITAATELMVYLMQQSTSQK